MLTYLDGETSSTVNSPFPLYSHISSYSPISPPMSRPESDVAQNTPFTARTSGESEHVARNKSKEEPSTVWSINDPFVDTISTPEGDPYDHFLNPLLERDTKQCDAWKDEVQNMLIFAGLFSAVVTAFIVESYQRLRSDANDAVVELLTRIAATLESPITVDGTSSVSSSKEVTFSPSRSDIRINIFWFISLVLSLTVAMVGTIILQWLREHQRYDNAWKPEESFAILNARRESLKRWYVPQIFAGLPLLLQCALVLFLAGMLDFLFTLHIEVAIAVTISTGVPIIFLGATTLLPTLQLYIMRFPHLLSVNNNIPAPCPYKSPQSLITRRIAVSSTTLLMCCGWGTAILYFAIFALPNYCVLELGILRRSVILPLWKASLSSFTDAMSPLKSFLTTMIRNFNAFPAQHMDWVSKARFFTGDHSPILREQFKHRSVLSAETERLRLDVQDHEWTSIDMSWLDARTCYSTMLNLNNLESVPPPPTAYLLRNLKIHRTVYDCVQGLHAANHKHTWASDTDEDVHAAALYNCADVFISQQVELWRQNSYYTNFYSDGLLYERYCIILSQIVQQGSPFTDIPFPLPSKMFVKSSSHPIATTEPPDLDVFRVACLRIFVHDAFYPSRKAPKMENRQHELHCKLLVSILQINPADLFMASNSDPLLPSWMGLYPAYIIHLRNDLLKPVTPILHAFFEKCLTLEPEYGLKIRPSPAMENYKAVFVYMDMMVFCQSDEDINNTLVLLQDICGIIPGSVQTSPFILLSACLYIEALVKWIRQGSGMEFTLLLDLLCLRCGHVNSTIDYAEGYSPRMTWMGLDNAIEWIYKSRSDDVSLDIIPHTTLPIVP